MLKTFESILVEVHHPQTLQMDKVKEFYNATIQHWWKKEATHHFSTVVDAKASIVEWFNRMLKSQLYRYFTAANTIQYVDILPSLVQCYIEDMRCSIGVATLVQAGHQDPMARVIARRQCWSFGKVGCPNTTVGLRHCRYLFDITK